MFPLSGLVSEPTFSSLPMLLLPLHILALEAGPEHPALCLAASWWLPHIFLFKLHDPAHLLKSRSPDLWATGAILPDNRMAGRRRWQYQKREKGAVSWVSQLSLHLVCPPSSCRGKQALGQEGGGVKGQRECCGMRAFGSWKIHLLG